jgi:hypothetical protein
MLRLASDVSNICRKQGHALFQARGPFVSALPKPLVRRVDAIDPSVKDHDHLLP